MIKLINVSKTYVSKTNIKVDALRGVSFELGNSGMVFILGKSGSGKSTLLNLLGGLDKPTSGDIVVDGVSTKDFKQADYDSYRSGYVGFVFQEYNLLDDFNVKENVALALQLTKGNDIDQKVVSALEQVELSANYLTRRVGELSGGEKQRVAIARSIVKDSRVILADEPTGNLDSATGESIWNILKNLSKDKLVVVVSHDRESAQKYADRVIEIADGAVISDSGEQSTEHSKSQAFSTQKNRLSFKACIKMAFNNMRQHKVRVICTVLLAAITTLALLVTQVSLSYTPENTIARFIEKNDVKYIGVAQRKNAKDTEIVGASSYSSARLKQEGLNYITTQSTCIVDNYIDSKQDIIDMGLTFIGEALELLPNSYYITKLSYERSLSIWGGSAIIDGKEISIKELENTSIEYLVGKKIVLRDYYSFHCLDMTSIDLEDYPTLCGVIDTDNLNELNAESIPSVFVTRDITCNIDRSASSTYNNRDTEVIMEFGNYPYSGIFKLTGENGLKSLGYKAALLTVDGLQTVNGTVPSPTSDRQIYLTFDLYSHLFGGSMTDYVDANLSSVVKMPEGLGKAYSMKFRDYNSGDLVGDAGEFTIAGIFFTTNFDSDNPLVSTYSIASNNCSKRYIQQALDSDIPITIRTDSVKNMAKFLKTLRYEYAITVVRLGYTPSENGGRTPVLDSYSKPIYDYENSVTTLQRILIVICAALVIALVLMVINTISLSITNRKREIGILSALGTSIRDITWIFLLETLFIAILCFVIGLTAMLIAQPIINKLNTGDYPYLIQYFNIDIVTVAVLFGSSFGLLLLATLIPIRKIAKLKPIDAIRNT